MYAVPTAARRGHGIRSLRDKVIEGCDPQFNSSLRTGSL